MSIGSKAELHIMSVLSPAEYFYTLVQYTISLTAMPPLITSFCLCFFIYLASAATIKYDWHVSWITANPDALQPRLVTTLSYEPG